VVGVVGLLEKATRYVTTAFREEGLPLVVLGGALTGQEEPMVPFGSSQYAQTILRSLWGLPPAVDLAYEERVQACCRELIAEGLAKSAHDLSDGGLGVALAECTMAGGVGAAVDLNFADDPRLLLFAEDPSRILITIADKNLGEVDRIVSEYNIRAARIGATHGTTLAVSHQGERLFEISLATLRSCYESPLGQTLEAPSK